MMARGDEVKRPAYPETPLATSERPVSRRRDRRSAIAGLEDVE